MKPLIKRNLRKLKQELKKELRGWFFMPTPRKILYDHHPKCGGTSLRLYLQAIYPTEKTFIIDGNNPMASVRRFKALPRYERHSYDLVNGHLAHQLLDYTHPSRLAITVFREPVDRIISHYFYAKHTSHHYLYSKIHEAGMSLEEYVTSDLSGELRNWYTTHYTGLTNDEAERNPEKSVTKAMEVVLKRYDIIGFLDDFEAFIETLRKRAKLRYEYKNKRGNKTKDRPFVKDISQSTIRRIKEVNHLDVVFYRKIREIVYSQDTIPIRYSTALRSRG